MYDFFLNDKLFELNVTLIILFQVFRVGKHVFKFTGHFYLCRAMDSKTFSHTSFLRSRDLVFIHQEVAPSLVIFLTSVPLVQKVAGIVLFSSHFLILTVTRHCQLLSHCCLNYWSNQVHGAHLSALFLLNYGKIEGGLNPFFPIHRDPEELW